MSIHKPAPDSVIEGTLEDGILNIHDTANALAYIEARDLRCRWVAANVKHLR